MPALEQIDCIHDALLWRVNGTDLNGQRTVTSIPIQIKCRWMDATSDVMNPDQSSRTYDVSLISKWTDLNIGDILWQGTADELGDSQSLTGTGTDVIPPGDLHIVTTFDSGPDLKGRRTRREAKLIRFTDRLPTGD